MNIYYTVIYEEWLVMSWADTKNDICAKCCMPVFQLSYHPGHDDLVQHIIDQAFRHFKYRDG